MLAPAIRPPRFSGGRSLLATLACAALLAGCAGPWQIGRIVPGTPRDAVLSQLGTPTGVVPLADGERLQYSGQPQGRYAWMVDLDAAGRFVRARQVLTAAEFSRIVPGEWRRQDVEREFGPPAMVERVARWEGPVLTYRWSDAHSTDMFYWVYLDAAGVVRRAHPGMEFRRFLELE